jgi:hypothetical protein
MVTTFENKVKQVIDYYPEKYGTKILCISINQLARKFRKDVFKSYTDKIFT